VCGATNVSVTNSTFTNISATQTILPIDQTTLPGFGALSSPQAAFQSGGNDTWAGTFEACKNVTVNNCTVNGVNSNLGDAFCFHPAADDSSIKISNCTFSNVTAPNTTVTPSLGAATAYGVKVENNSGPIIIENCTTRNFSGASVEPFPTPAVSPTTVNGNQSLTVAPFTLTVTSTTGFPESGLISVVTTDAIPLKIVRYSGVTPTTFTGCIATGSFSTLDTSAVTGVGLVISNDLAF
jgi:hypothetical protein